MRVRGEQARKPPRRASIERMSYASMSRGPFFAGSLPVLLIAAAGCPEATRPPRDPVDEPPAVDAPEPLGDLVVAPAAPDGEVVVAAAVTNGYEDAVVGPLVVDGVTYTLVVPAVALEEGVEITMEPVVLVDAPFTRFGAVRFGPAGLEFRVPATLVVEGVPQDAPLASALLDDDGAEGVLTFAANDEGTVRAAIPHFSVASIVDAGTTRAAIAAAGLAAVPFDPQAAASALTRALNDIVLPAVDGAGDSLQAFVLAQRLLAEWNAAVQVRGLQTSPFSGLGGETFGQAGADAVDRLVVEGQGLVADLQQPVCRDGSGQLHHPFDWFGALGHAASSLRLLGGDAAAPSEYAPCLTLAFAPAVSTQGAALPDSQRFVQVFVGIEATTPTGFTAPVAGSYLLEVEGAAGIDGATSVFFDAPSPALSPVDLDRGEDCAARTGVQVALTGALRDTLGLGNLRLDPVETILTFPEQAAFALGGAQACEEAELPTVVVSPSSVVVDVGGSVQFTAVTSPDPATPVVWSASAGTIDQAGLFTAPTEPGPIRVSAVAGNGSLGTSDATVAVVRVGVFSSSASTAFDATGNQLPQFNTWQWTLDTTQAITGGEVVLSRAERFEDPPAPAFRVASPVELVNTGGNAVTLRLADPGGGEIHQVTFAPGVVRTLLMGTPSNLPPAMCVFCDPRELRDASRWDIDFTP